jgi:hypothetical protein
MRKKVTVTILIETSTTTAHQAKMVTVTFFPALCVQP